MVKRTLRFYKQNYETELIAIRKFNSQVDFLEQAIHQAKESIPTLRKQLEHYLEKLPDWEKTLEIEKASLKTHMEFLNKSKNKLMAAEKRDRILIQLSNLDSQL